MGEKGVLALERAAKAAADIERLEPQLIDARSELHAAIVDAYRSGVSVDLISRASTLSKQRIYQLLQKAGATPTNKNVGIVASTVGVEAMLILPVVVFIPFASLFLH